MSEEKKIYCTQCGSENAAGSKFCVNCGSKLEELPAQNDTAEAAQEMPEEKNVYAEGLPSEQEPVFEKVTNAEEIKPEPIQGQAQQEDIHITYETPAQTQYYDSSNSQAETVSEKKGNSHCVPGMWNFIHSLLLLNLFQRCPFHCSDCSWHHYAGK